MGSSAFRYAAQFILLQACLLLRGARDVSAGEVRLVHSYPLADNFSRVSLRCREGAEDSLISSFIPDAQFFRGGEVITRENVFEYTRTIEGALSYTITPETEGILTCRHDRDTSNAVALAGEPPEHYDCSNNNANPIQYQLLQYSELDQYSIPCTVKPGKLRDRYSIAWFSIQSGNFGSLTTVDMSNFDVRINSTSLPRYENWLSCRVDIDHAGGNVRQYCGRRMRAAVAAEIITPPSPITVTTGNPVNLTCTARGSDIDFEWTFRGRSYTSTTECRNGVCVHADPHPTAPPLTVTSRLSLSGIETSTARNIDIACTVIQNLPAEFNAVRQSSITTVTVVEESHITDSETDPTMDTPPLTPNEHSDTPSSGPTSSATTTPSDSPPGLNDQHITLIIIAVVVIIMALLTTIVVVVIVIAVIVSRRGRRTPESSSAVPPPCTDLVPVPRQDVELSQLKSDGPTIPPANGSQLSYSATCERQMSVNSDGTANIMERRNFSVTVNSPMSFPAAAMEGFLQGGLPGQVPHPSSPGAPVLALTGGDLSATHSAQGNIPAGGIADCDTTDGPQQNLHSPTSSEGPLHASHPPSFLTQRSCPCPQQTYKRSALTRYCERHNPRQILTRFWSVSAQVLTNEAVVTDLRTGSAMRIFSPPSSATDSVSPQESVSVTDMTSETELQREEVPVYTELPTIRDTSCEPVVVEPHSDTENQTEPQETTVGNKPLNEPWPDSDNDDRDYQPKLT